MNMTPGVRKLALTVHITTSIGWFGAVAGFLALAVAGLLTGIVQSLGTLWGLFRHYWVLAKLIVTARFISVISSRFEGGV